jgi:hypothetical protein
MKIYLNIKTSEGVETIDQLDKEDFKTFVELNKEVKRLINEYHIAGIAAYRSSRAASNWK